MSEPNCPCDLHSFPLLPLPIPPGLDALPRQLGGFSDFRAALLAQIQHGPKDHPSLARWRARDPDDFGLMLLEMFAYVCDVVSFYDEVLANESYLRTAVQRASLRKLVGLIGYLPKPALAASVKLAVLVEGRGALALPPGTAFRSAAFGAEPPQIFETSAALTADPDANRWAVVPPRAASLSGQVTSLLLAPSSARVKKGDPVYLAFGAGVTQTAIRIATKVAPSLEADGARYIRVDLDQPITLGQSHPLAEVRLLVPTKRTGLWTQQLQSDDPDVNEYDWQAAGNGLYDYWFINGTRFLLRSLQRDVGVGDLLLFQVPDRFEATTVYKVDEPPVTVAPANTINVGSTPVDVPAVKAPTTRVWVDKALPTWPTFSTDWSDPTTLVIHYGLIDAGTLVAPASSVLADSDPIVLASVHVPPAGPPPVNEVLLASADQRGLASGASIDFVARAVTLDSTTNWTPPFELPVQVYGNVVSATRGETVRAEIAGSGDAAIASQSFTLQKKPLTYLPSPSAQNEWGAVSTLDIHVDGYRWTEVPSFFGAAPDAQVFVVRQRDDGVSTVTFGDGVDGARLPTGIGNVVASYRFGAGAASPPAFSIKQVARPVPRLKSVVNPVAAAGGEDAEAPESLRKRAPAGALLLGRAVSVQDFEAAAAAVGGVRLASAEWRWLPDRHRPGVQIAYIGPASLAPTVSQRLRGISDPSTAISVTQAIPVPVNMSIGVETDARMDAAVVVAAVRDALLAPGTGLLEPERLGITKPLFRSRILQTVLSVPGALAVLSLTWNGLPFSDYGQRPASGCYFDFESGGLFVSGSPSHG